MEGRTESGGRRGLAAAGLLTAGGLLAPGVQVLPGRLAALAGGLAWLAPLLALPPALLWVWGMGRLCREEDPETAAPGRGLTLLYIGWILFLTAGQWQRTAERMASLQGTWGWLTAGVTAALVLRLLRRGPEALGRAGRVFGIALLAVLGVVLAAALPGVDPGRLAPRPGDGRGLFPAVLECLGLLAAAAPAAGLLGARPGKEGRRTAVWVTAACLTAAGLTAVTVGRLGPGLTARLPRAFFVLVQGLGVEGGPARLEAPVSALWLLADFCRFGILLGAAFALTRARGRGWAAAGVTAAALLPALLLPLPTGTAPALILGAGLPLARRIGGHFRKGNGGNGHILWRKTGRHP